MPHLKGDKAKQIRVKKQNSFAEMIKEDHIMPSHTSSEAIAKAFTDARLKGGSIRNYPGQVPEDLNEAYAIQDAAIKFWPQDIAGWKIGGIGGDYAVRFNEIKLAGPVFGNQVYRDVGQTIDMPVFADGFAAIEPELVFIVKKDAPIDKTDWTIEEAKDYVGKVHIGVEIASSPFPDINDMGPLVTISDFGNNNGLIIGEELTSWHGSSLSDWTVETIIESKSVGTTTPPDPMTSFRFVLENTARRGMPLKKDMPITTGAITGVHRAYSGQTSTIKCSGAADINLRLVDT